MNLPHRPTLLSPLSPQAPARPGGLPSGYVPFLWRDPGRTPSGEPVDLVMATLRFPACGAAGYEETLCGPVFIAGDVPPPVSWNDEDLVFAYLKWADRRGFVPQPHGVPQPSVWDMLSSRHPFLIDVGLFGKIIAWAYNTRAEMLAAGKFFQYSEDAAWEIFLDEGLPGLKAHFAQAHLDADQGKGGGTRAGGGAATGDGTTGGTPLYLTPETKPTSGKRVRIMV